MISSRRIQDSFNVFDIDGCGELKMSDVILLLQGIGFNDVTKEELVAMCKAMDTDCSGAISYSELEKGVMRKACQKDSAEEVWKAFNLIDCEAKGRIALEDIERVAQHHDPSMTKIECQIAFSALAEGSHAISYDAWKCALNDLRSTLFR